MLLLDSVQGLHVRMLLTCDLCEFPWQHVLDNCCRNCHSTTCTDAATNEMKCKQISVSEGPIVAVSVVSTECKQGASGFEGWRCEMLAASHTYSQLQ